MKLWNVLLLLIALVQIAGAQPRACAVWVDGVLFASDDQQRIEPICAFGESIPNVAQGSIVLVTGYTLGPRDELSSSVFPPSTNLGGVSVRLTVGGVSIDAYVLSAQEHRVRALVPSRAPAGEGTIVVAYDGQVSPPSRLRIVPRNLRLYFHQPRQNVAAGGALRENRFTEPARPGQQVVLWGTGLGAVGADEAPRSIPSSVQDLEVRVGLERARIVFAGRSDCCAGVDQIVIEIPAGNEGCHVPVAARFLSEERLSNYVSLAIAASASTCSDPHGMSEAARASLEANRNLTFGSIALGQFGWNPDGVSAAFFRTNDHLRIPLGSCGVPVGNIVTSHLDAGPELRFTAPLGEQAVPEREDYNTDFYKLYELGFPSEELAPGTYSIHNGDGTASVGPFRITIALPESSLRWDNPDALRTITKGEDLTITWETGDAPDGYVELEGTFLTFPQGEPNGYGLGGFSCLERADRGRFTVPAWVAWEASRASATSVDLRLRHYTVRDFTAQGLDFGQFLHVRPLGSARAAIDQHPR